MFDVIGREHELRLLDEWLAAALDGSGRFVLCSGEPGIGKTRLARTLVDSARERGVPTAWGRGADSAPYGGWHRVLGVCAELVDSRADRGDRTNLAVLVPELGADADAAAAPPGERARVFDSAARFLLTAATREGLVVVVDDLHQADRPSLLLSRHLVHALGRRTCRLLVVGTYRDTAPIGGTGLGDLLTDLVAEPCTEQLHLQGLDENAVRALLARVSGSELPVAEVRRAHELTGGNPFFVGELGRALREGASFGTTRSLRDALSDRLTQLPPACADLLRAASVVGREFHVGVVAQMRGAPALECLDLLDTAAAAKLVEPAEAPGRYRFVHELIRDAIEAGLGAAERVRLHHNAALGIERYHASRLEPHLTRLAHHWANAAAAGEGDVAAGWATRAADEAMRRLAFEEGVRLYRLALDVGSTHLDEPAVADLLLRLARGLYRSGELQSCLETCQDAATVARRLNRPDLVGEAALVLESLGEPRINLVVRDLCREALDGLGEAAPALRARLLAQLTEAWIYLGETDGVDTASRDAMTLAEHTADTAALVAALRARHLTARHPADAAERLALADRLEDVARTIPGAEPAMWAHLWRIAAWFDVGDLAAAAAELPRLARAVERVRTPLARWQVARSSATLAQAQGRFAEAHRFAREALDLLTGIGHPGAQHHFYAVACAVGHHTGPPPGLAQEIAAFPGEFGPFSDARPLARAVVLLDSGQRPAADEEYRKLGPVGSWQPPWFLARIALAMRTLAAVGIENRDDAAALYDRLKAEQGRHVTGVGGTAVYLGPVELYLGMAARLVGDLDVAVTDLERAVDVSDRAGARPFGVEARYELGRTLVARAATGDLDRARSLLDDARAAGLALGMAPFVDRAGRLVGALGGDSRSGLSNREQEVAALVARGMSNRGIAEALVVSERTAQNHVQHILTKLGFSTRAQIAAWVVGRNTSE